MKNALVRLAPFAAAPDASYAWRMIAAVLFDLDETLLDRTASLKAFLADQFARHAADLGAVEADRWQRRFLELDQRGHMPKTLVYPQLLVEFGGRAAAAKALLRDYREGCCRFARGHAGMAETLRALRAAGLKLGIVTNGATEFQSRHVAALSLHTLVDTVLISEREGVRKPDRAIFHRAAERLGAAPAQCLFVGDNPRADILGAAEAGMQTAWFQTGFAWPEDLPPRQGHVIRSLPDVLPIIRDGGGEIGS